jgi:hypothetical protein
MKPSAIGEDATRQYYAQRIARCQDVEEAITNVVSNAIDLVDLGLALRSVLTSAQAADNVEGVAGNDATAEEL